MTAYTFLLISPVCVYILICMFADNFAELITTIFSSFEDFSFYYFTAVGSGDIVTASRVFSSNETITTAKLHEQLSLNDGVYLNLIDEIEGLFESLEARFPR